MHILLTGATGLIGNLLLKRLLVEGHQLSYCTTSKSKLALFPNCKGVYWNPEKLELEYQSLSSVDIIIHLAGATIMQPWTSNNKQQIRNSRVKGLQTLKKYQKYFAPNLSQIVVASAIGAYPDDGKLQFEESFPTYAPNFLGEVTQALEKEAQAFEKLDVLVTTLRFGLVLSKKGGAFVPIEKSVRLGLGASFGSGNQWQSWIHIEDVIGIIHFVLKHRKAGVYNTVAPQPITQKVLLNTIATTLKKSLWLPNIPSFVFKWILGERAVLLLASQYVLANKIVTLGYSFKFPNIKSAVKDLVS